MKLIALNIPEKVFEEIQKYKRAKGVSLSSLVRSAIFKKLKELQEQELK